jgi:uncharacterized membrane protein YedE/YeeE
MIDWAHFTPWLSLSGGLLIGLSASILILLSGRILGVSGILGGLLTPKDGDMQWRITFLLGMAAAALTLHYVGANAWIHTPDIDTNYSTIAVAGLMVGFGTRYGSGCTSGHGVCGISRLSPRSIIATVVFMVSGSLVVYVTRHFV